MQQTLTDAELVGRHLAGDRGALAAVYDRYGASLYDTAAAMTRDRHDAADVVQDVFVTAAERLGQLRDPDKLKPWLFAILRNEVYRRTRRRGRSVATDFSGAAAEAMAPLSPAEDAAGVEYDELAALVRAAAAGLDERDRLVLELSIRQGLEGRDLADALGVSAQQSYGLVHRMRQRTERSLAAFCVARTGRADCPDLAELLGDWDGEFSVLVRKRVARHVDDCDVCERSRTRLAPLPLFAAAPVLVAPPDLRERVLGAIGTPRPAAPYGFEAPGGFPSVVRSGRRLVTWLVGAGAVGLLGAGIVVLTTDGATGPTLAIDAGPAVATTLDPAPPPPDTAVTPESTPDATSTTTTTPTSTTTTSTTTTSSSTTTTTPTTTTVDAAPVVPVVTATPTTPPPTSVAPTTTAAATTTTAAPTTTVPAPGALGLSAGSIDFGTGLAQATLTLTNTGGRPLAWSATTASGTNASGTAASGNSTSGTAAASPFGVSPASGQLAPGASVTVTVTLDRSWPVEGPLPDRTVNFSAAGTDATVTLAGTIARPPLLVPVTVPPSFLCPGSTQGFFWRMAISDESPPFRAEVRVTGPSGVSVVSSLSEDGDWFGFVDANFDGDEFGTVDPGVHRWTVTATDAFDNRSTVSGTVTVNGATSPC